MFETQLIFTGHMKGSIKIWQRSVTVIDGVVKWDLGLVRVMQHDSMIGFLYIPG